MFQNRVAPALHWSVPDNASQDVKALAERLQVSPILAQILVARNLADPELCREFLNPTAQPLLDPMLLRDMPVAVKRIQQALAAGETILAYGDYDVDGTCSLAIMQRSLELLGGSVEIHVPHRLQEGYGLRREIMEQAAAKGIRLIVTVDTGVRSHDVIEYARTLGIDVIVTDHHLPDTSLPPAVAVVNPNRSDCPYPNKHLCGAGVTFKLIHALLQQSSVPVRRQEQFLSSLLKPVSIATLADVVPLIGENRTLVARGLFGLQSIRNPGLAALFSVAGIPPGQIPSSQQIAFRIAPRINAAGRMESARAVTDLLLTSDAPRAKQLALQLNQWNTDRQQIERTIVENILGSEDCQDSMTGHVFWIPDAHLGVLGIVASRLVEQLGRPVIVLTDDPKERGVLAGSGRSTPGFHLLEALESMADLFVNFGGHSQAAGLRLRYSELDDFRSRFIAYTSQHFVCGSRARSVDAAVQFSDLTPALEKQLQMLGPFGFGNPAPVLLAHEARVAGPIQTLTPGRHFVVPLTQGGCTLRCKAWNFAEHIDLIRSGTPVDVLLQLERDDYSARRGALRWSVTVRDVRPSVSD